MSKRSETGRRGAKKRQMVKKRAQFRERTRQRSISEKQMRVKRQIGWLCQTNTEGEILKSMITVDNFNRIKKLIKTLDIEIVKTHRGTFSYRQYCKLFESYLFKNKKCGTNDDICCQAITEDGNRCTRPASKFTTIDLTEVQILPKIPDFIKNTIGVKKTEQLKLIGFANTCCFYCWQHAAMYAAEGSTYVSNFAYYAAHPEDLLRIFFEDVQVNKFAGLLTYNVKIDIDSLKSADEIIKSIYKTNAAMSGMFTSYYWGIFIVVFMYDTIKPYIVNFLSGTKDFADDILENIGLTAAKVLININEE